MLDYIRSNAQSFGVKVAFAIIILVFMFWGVGSLTDGGSSNVVAKVNGEAITAQQFEQAYQRAAEYAMRNDPSLTREALVQQKLGRQVLNELISAQLIRQEAARVGMTVSPEEMHYVVSKLPAFQDVQGKFDPEAYKRNIEAQRMSVAEYEQGLADSILRDKVMRTVAGSAWAAGDEARKYYDFLTQQRTVEYLYLPAADFAASVKPTEEELNAWYEAHKAELASQPRVEVEYVAVAPEGLVRPESVSAEAALKWYEANKQRFRQPEQVKVAHILVPLAENAPEAAVKQAMEKAVRIRSEAEKGDFAAVANANNGPNAAGPGGELGWIQRGQTVKPFEDAAWALQPGQISEPVRSQFGLHIIKMEERKDASVQPFAEVEAEVRATLAKQEGVEKVNDVLDSLIGDNINNRPLQESAASVGSYKDADGKVTLGYVDVDGLKAGTAVATLTFTVSDPTAVDASTAVTVHQTEINDQTVDVTEDLTADLHQDTKVVNAKPATCTEDGYTGDTVCAACGKVLAKGEVIKALGHDYKDGTCTRCGDKQPGVNTGDNSTMTMWTMSAVMALAGAAVLVLRSRKEKYEG